MLAFRFHFLIPEGFYNRPQAISDLGIVESKEIPEDAHNVEGREVLLISWDGSNGVKVTNDFDVFRSRGFPLPLPTRNLGIMNKDCHK